MSRDIRLHFEAGGNFIDTANLYTNGTSETMVGDFVAGDRDHYVIGTKYSCSTDASDPNAGGNHRKNVFVPLFTEAYVGSRWIMSIFYGFMLGRRLRA